MNENEQDDAATPRAGGNVVWKGPSHVPPAESADEKSNTASPEAPETETRAGGNVYTKGASQKTAESQ